MNKLTAIAAATTILVTEGVPAFAGDTLDRVMEKNVIVMATDPAWPPQSFLNENQEMDGFDVDVGREIAKRLGVAIEFVTPDWTLITGGNWAGRWDLSVGSMTPTVERAKVLDFPGVYYYVPAVAAVHNDSDAQKISDLNDRRFGVSVGSTWHEYLEHTLVIDAVGAPAFEYQIVPSKVTAFGTEIHVVDQLRLGDGIRVDAVIDSLSTILNAQKNEYPIRVVGEPLFYEPLSVAVDRGDDEFSEKIAAIITEMHADGALQALSEKWYGVDYTSVK